MPEDICYSEYPDGKRQFYQISNVAEDMTTDEIQLYIALQQAKNIRSIKKYTLYKRVGHIFRRNSGHRFGFGIFIAIYIYIYIFIEILQNLR